MNLREAHISLDTAYNDSVLFTKSHYENFPVISLFLPKLIRKHVAVVYRFARQADDLADEGNDSVAQKIERLELYKKNLEKCINGQFESDFWMALKDTIDKFNLTPQYFLDLLSAFKQDVTVNRYKTYNDVLDYCRRSANPVGRLILEFFGIKDQKLCGYSDAICTALQLTNFYQDVSVDILKNRIYIPLDEIQKYGVNLNQFLLKKNDDNFKKLLFLQVKRTRDMFMDGENLLKYLPSNLKKQIKMTILGGEKILEKIKLLDYNVINFRPKLSKIDYLKIFIQAII